MLSPKTLINSEKREDSDFKYWQSRRTALVTTIMGKGDGILLLREHNLPFDIDYSCYSSVKENLRGAKDSINIVVLKIKRKHYGKYVLKAVKSENDTKSEESVKNELSISFSTQHDNIVEFYKCLVSDSEFKNSSQVYLLMEYCSKGACMHYNEETKEYRKYNYSSERKDDRAFNHVEAVEIMRPILDALIYLHEKRITHLDIKPQNILIQPGVEHFTPMLTDFGISRRIKEDERKIQLEGGVGTPYFYSPERGLGGLFDPYKDDVWGVGTTFYTLLTAQVLKKDGFKLTNKVPDELEKEYELFKEDILKIIEEQATEFEWLKDICMLDPGKRPTMTAIKKDIIY